MMVRDKTFVILVMGKKTLILVAARETVILVGSGGKAAKHFFLDWVAGRLTCESWLRAGPTYLEQFGFHLNLSPSAVRTTSIRYFPHSSAHLGSSIGPKTLVDGILAP